MSSVGVFACGNGICGRGAADKRECWTSARAHGLTPPMISGGEQNCVSDHIQQHLIGLVTWMRFTAYHSIGHKRLCAPAPEPTRQTGRLRHQIMNDTQHNTTQSIARGRIHALYTVHCSQVVHTLRSARQYHNWAYCSHDTPSFSAWVGRWASS